MRIPDTLSELVDSGIIEAVVRPLMSGKEAQIYLLRSGGELRVAKVYKAAQDRSFRQRAEYTEGRKVRNTRDQRAMSKRTRHGREQDEIAWRATEVDMIYRLHAAGVRVPKPFQFIDGVLIMELIVDDHGDPAPRLGDVDLDREGALAIYEQLIRYVVQMLCADVVHGDLSEFNVLMTSEGPVIIDLPQAVNAAGNQNARQLLLRDVDNLHRFIARFAPEQKRLPYAEEMWQLYERGELTPDARLTGRYRAADNRVDTTLVLELIADAERDERHRRSAKGQSMHGRGASDVAPSCTPERGPSTRRAQPSREQNFVHQPRQKPDLRESQNARTPQLAGQRRQGPDAQSTRAQKPNEHRRHQPNVRPPQPAGGWSPSEQRRHTPDVRHTQPARAQDQARQPQPARNRTSVEQRQHAVVSHRQLQRDPRDAQAAHGHNPVKQRHHGNSRGQRETDPPVRSREQGAVDQRSQTPPARAQDVSKGRGPTPTPTPTPTPSNQLKRSNSNPPLPAAGPKGHRSPRREK